MVRSTPRHSALPRPPRSSSAPPSPAPRTPALPAPAPPAPSASGCLRPHPAPPAATCPRPAARRLAALAAALLLLAAPLAFAQQGTPPTIDPQALDPEAILEAVRAAQAQLEQAPTGADLEPATFRLGNGMIPEAVAAPLPTAGSVDWEAVMGDSAAVVVRGVPGPDLCDPSSHGFRSYEMWVLEAGEASRLAVDPGERRARLELSGPVQRLRLLPSDCDRGTLSRGETGWGRLSLGLATTNHFSHKNFMAADLAPSDPEQAVLSMDGFCQFMEQAVVPFYRDVESGAIPMDAELPVPAEPFVEVGEGVAARSGPAPGPVSDRPGLAPVGADHFGQWFVHEYFPVAAPEAGGPPEMYAFRDRVRRALEGQDGPGAADYLQAQQTVRDLAGWLRPPTPLNVVANAFQSYAQDTFLAPFANYLSDMKTGYIAGVAFAAQAFAGGIPNGPQELPRPTGVLRDPRQERPRPILDADTLGGLVFHVCDRFRAANVEAMEGVELSRGHFSGPGIHTPVSAWGAGGPAALAVDPRNTVVGPAPDVEALTGIDVEALIEQHAPDERSRQMALEGMNTAVLHGQVATFRGAAPPRDAPWVLGWYRTTVGAEPLEEAGATEGGGEGGDAAPHPPASTGVVVQEIQPDAGRPEGAWAELANTSGGAVDLTGWSLEWSGLSLGLPAGVGLEAEGVLVLAADAEAFGRVHPGAWVLPATGIGGGRTPLVLRTGTGAETDRVPLAGSPWPATGDGRSLVLADPAGDNADPRNWSASPEPGGSPGR